MASRKQPYSKPELTKYRSIREITNYDYHGDSSVSEGINYTLNWDDCNAGKQDVWDGWGPNERGNCTV